MIPRIPKNYVTTPHPVAPRVDLYESFGGRWRMRLVPGVPNPAV